MRSVAFEDDTMRVLILTAILAAASAAPSGELKDAAPLAVLPVVAPTIDPGDLQAAAINAQVAAEDQARAAVDRIVEENNEKVIESDSLVKEKTEENFWAGQDKKWQALDAVQTAAAKIDGAVASNADAIARSAIGGVVLPNLPTYISPSLIPAPIVRTPIVPGAPIPPAYPLYGAPVISPISPIVYTPGIIAKKEEEKEKQLVKTAEPEKDKKVLQTLEIASTPIADTKSDINDKDKDIDKLAESEKDKKQVVEFQTIYQTRLISPTYYYYNPNILVTQEEDVKKTEKKIEKAAEQEKDKQILLYSTRIVSTPIITPISIVYSTGSLPKDEDVLKSNEIEKNTKNKKEETKLDEKKEEKLEKPDKDKLEKPLIAPILPLVAPQPWPLSPVAPVFVPPPLLARW